MVHTSLSAAAGTFKAAPGEASGWVSWGAEAPAPAKVGRASGDWVSWGAAPESPFSADSNPVSDAVIAQAAVGSSAGFNDSDMLPLVVPAGLPNLYDWDQPLSVAALRTALGDASAKMTPTASQPSSPGSLAHSLTPQPSPPRSLPRSIVGTAHEGQQGCHSLPSGKRAAASHAGSSSLGGASPLALQATYPCSDPNPEPEHEHEPEPEPDRRTKFYTHVTLPHLAPGRTCSDAARGAPPGWRSDG